MVKHNENFMQSLTVINLEFILCFLAALFAIMFYSKVFLLTLENTIENKNLICHATQVNKKIQEIKNISFNFERYLLGQTCAKNEILKKMMILISTSRKAYITENINLYPQISWACIHYNQLWKMINDYPHSPELVKNLQEHLQSFREKI